MMSAMEALYIPGALLLLALAFLFLPVRPPTQSPFRWHWLVEMLLPGSSPAWSWVAGVALALWGYLLAQLWFFWWTGSTSLIAAIAVPNLTQAYGVSCPPGAELKEVALANPHAAWLYGAPMLLFLVNLVLVLARRRSAESP